MKKKIIAILMLCFLIATGYVYSQDRPPMGGPREGKRPSAEEMMKMELKMMKQDLDLTETQVAFVKKILEDSYKKVEESFQNGKKVIDEMGKIMEEKDNNLKRVLTDEQWTKYKDIKDKMKDRNKRDDNKMPPPPDRN